MLECFVVKRAISGPFRKFKPVWQAHHLQLHGATPRTGASGRITHVVSDVGLMRGRGRGWEGKSPWKMFVLCLKVFWLS
jgi:hypothetical protein